MTDHSHAAVKAAITHFNSFQAGQLAPMLWMGMDWRE